MGFFSKSKKAEAEELEEVNFLVVGRSKHPDVKLNPGNVFHASIRPEPKNKFDPNAIAVYVGNKQAGYLSASSAARHAGRFKRAMEVPAVVATGRRGELELYVTLMVPPRED